MNFLKNYKFYIILSLIAISGCMFIAWKDGFNAAKEVFIYMLFGCTFLIIGNFLLKRKK